MDSGDIDLSEKGCYLEKIIYLKFNFFKKKNSSFFHFSFFLTSIEQIFSNISFLDKEVYKKSTNSQKYYHYAKEVLEENLKSLNHLLMK